MTRRSKMILGWSVAIVSLLVAAGLGAFWYALQQPLYRPGVLAASMPPEGVPPLPRGAALDPFWTVEPGIRLHHFAVGEGRNVLVLHGGPGLPFREGGPGLQPFSSRFRFHYYDQRGCGRSTRPLEHLPTGSTWARIKALEATLGLGAQIRDVERIRRLLGEERLVLVGHSFGAFLATLYAVEFPDRVAGLLLVAPATVLVMPPAEGDLFGRVRALLPAGSRTDYDAFLREYLDFPRLLGRSETEVAALNGRFARFYAEAARSQGFVVAADVGAEIGGFMVQAQYLSMGRRHDYRPALAAVACPTLVVHGTRDLQSEAGSRTYVEAIRSSRLAVVEGAGHVPFLDQPERFAAAVRPFFDALE